MEIIKKAKWLYIALSVIYLTVGIVLLIYPTQTIDAITRIIGITAIALGIYEMLKFIFRKSTDFVKVLSLFAGIFSFICGIILLINPNFIRTFLPVIIGVYIVLDSAFKLMTSIELRNAGSKVWWGVFFLALAGVIFGFIIVFNAKEISALVIRLIGVSLIIESVENIFAVISTLLKTPKITSNTVEAEYKELSTEDVPSENE